MRIAVMTGLAIVLATGAMAQQASLAAESAPAPRCYRKTTVPAVYEARETLLRKARLVHEETPSGQIVMKHFPAIYVEEKTLVTPAYILLQEVACTKRVLRRAEPLPASQCVKTKGCEELPVPKP